MSGHWPHHDPAVRELIEKAKAEAWDEGEKAGQHNAWNNPTLDHQFANPYTP